MVSISLNLKVTQTVLVQIKPNREHQTDLMKSICISRIICFSIADSLETKDLHH